MLELNVKEYVDETYEKLKKIVGEKSGKRLDIYQVGSNPASNKYVNNKIKKCEMLGITVTLNKIVSKDVYDINKFILEECGNRSTKAMIQLPVPKGVNVEKYFWNSSLSDVDGLCSRNKEILHTDMGKEYIENNVYFNIPCTARGVAEYLVHLDGKEKLDGKTVLVIGRSGLVGKPVSRLFDLLNMTVLQANSHTPREKLNELLKVSDYVVVAVGKPNFINSSMISEGTTIVDVGINVDHENKIVGDFNVLPCDRGKDFRYTPVPRGVGLLTVMTLMKNILEIPIYTELED